MSYIAPNSEVEIYIGGSVELTLGNENYYYFASASERDNYFTGITSKYTFSDQYYIHKDKGHIRINTSPANLIGACYMRYKNPDYENRWIYAYVTRVEYVSNVVQDVFFVIDSVTTWLPYAQLKHCFVERQHSTTDSIGDNLVDEGFPQFDTFIEEKYTSGLVGSLGYSYCVATTFNPANPSQDNVGGSEVGGIYTGLTLSYLSASGVNDLIEDAQTAGKTDGIIGISVVPNKFLTDSGDDPAVASQTFTKPYTSFGSYTNIKNNKLFTYPFKSLSVTNMEGSWKEYKIEDFSGTVCGFEFVGVTGLETQIVCSPVFYKSENHYIADNITMSDFPLCSWKTDPYQCYLAQNKSSRMLGFAQGIGGGAMSGMGIMANTIQSNKVLAEAGAGTIPLAPMTGVAVGSAIIGTIGNVIGTLAMERDIDRKPQSLNGQQGVNAILKRNLTTGERKEFYFIFHAIKPEYARIVDDYFTMYGYAQKKVQQPNIHARSRFTYVKTVGCQIGGAIPSDDKRYIEKRFDEGVRFWVDKTYFCNYNSANSLLS